MQKRFVALLVAVVMSLTFTLACADDAFLSLVGILIDEDYAEQSYYLGTDNASIIDADSEDLALYVFYNTDDEQLVIYGLDDENTPCYAVWSNVSFNQGLVIVAIVCNLWDTLAGMQPEGYVLGVGIVNNTDEDSNIYITSSENAAAFLSALESATADE